MTRRIDTGQPAAEVTSTHAAAGRPTQIRASLVESIPLGLEDLRGTPGVQYTEDVLVRMTNEAQKTLDVTAMYWNLLPDTKGHDESGFSESQLDELGAKAGRDLLNALHHAAARGVTIRILESPGFGPQGQTTESQQLQEAFPDQVTLFEINMGDWYGGAGIMHQKIWIFDQRHVYLGSANMDWKSIMQVKEMGVAVENSPTLANDATRYFEGWCEFATLKPPQTVAVFDPVANIQRTVPVWSDLAPEDQRARSPLATKAFTTNYNLAHPMQLTIDGDRSEVFLSGCPREVGGPGRTYDGDALVHTIQDARRSVCISVMDFAPFSLYSRQGNDKGNGNKDSSVPGADAIPTDTPVWWPELFDALLSSALTRKTHVRLLISNWAHTAECIAPGLQALQQAANAGRASPYMSAGQLEIKQFMVPGWNSTTGTHRQYPGHSRVNHTKYIVTDRRINIGTSNMTWDYFTSTAGSSFNTDHAGLVTTLQAVFDRDWRSPYAYALD